MNLLQISYYNCAGRKNETNKQKKMFRVYFENIF